MLLYDGAGDLKRARVEVTHCGCDQAIRLSSASTLAFSACTGSLAVVVHCSSHPSHRFIAHMHPGHVVRADGLGVGRMLSPPILALGLKSSILPSIAGPPSPRRLPAVILERLSPREKTGISQRAGISDRLPMIGGEGVGWSTGSGLLVTVHYSTHPHAMLLLYSILSQAMLQSYFRIYS